MARPRERDMDRKKLEEDLVNLALCKHSNIRLVPAKPHELPEWERQLLDLKEKYTPV